MITLLLKKISLFILASILFCFLSVPAPAASQSNGIPVLLYHHVAELSSVSTSMSELTVTPTEFDRQLTALQTSGFRTIPLALFISYMKGNAVTLPAKPIVLTFDDGYADNYNNAFPLLKKHGFTATLFMVGINFDRQNRLSSAQIREMNANGCEVGAHSMTHPNLTALSAQQLQTEINGSKSKATRQSQSDIIAFAYPGGQYSLAAMEKVETAGYEAAFTILTGLNNPQRDNRYLLRRIPIFQSTDFDHLLTLLNANHPKTRLFDYTDR